MIAKAIMTVDHLTPAVDCGGHSVPEIFRLDVAVSRVALLLMLLSRVSVCKYP